jgi:Ca2+-binding RTX toxin-like protein
LWECEPLEVRRLLADFTQFGAQLEAKLAAFQNSLNTEIREASNLPILGGELDKVSDLSLFPASVLTNLKNELASPTAGATVVDSAVRDAVFIALGPGGAKVVDDVGDITVTTPGDTIELTINVDRKLAAHDVSWKLGTGLASLPVRLDTNGTVNFDVDVSIPGLKFTFDAATPTNPSFGHGAPSITAKASLKDGSSVTGIVGFLRATAKNSTGKQSTVNATFTAAANSLDFTATGTADVDLNLSLGAGSSFPSLQSDLQLDWTFGSAPTVVFDNVGIGLGTFFSEMILPVLERIEQITRPALPLNKLVRAPIPGFTQMTEALGLGPTSIESLAKAAASNGVLPPDWALWVNLATTIIDAHALIDDATLGPDVRINFGDFDLSGINGDLRSASGANFGNMANFGQSISSLSAGAVGRLDIANLIGQLNNQIPSGPGLDKAKAALTKLKDLAGNGVNYDFPMLDNPSAAVFKLLLGQDADMARFKAQFKQGASFDIDAPFSILGQKITVEGTITVDAAGKIAYDTYGLRKLLSGGSVSDLIGGFYIDAGSEVDSHFYITGGITAKAAAGLPLAEFSVNGSINASLKMDVEDGSEKDGKLRFLTSEATEDCVWKAEGVATAGLFAQVRIGFEEPFTGEFIGISKDFGIASGTLFEFPDDCIALPTSPTPPPPKLAEVQADGTLLLFMGPDANRRENVGNNTDGDEAFFVRKVGGTSGDETYEVSAFNATQRLEHVKSIRGIGGNANDSIVVELAETDVSGNPLTNVEPPASPAYLRGDGGNDNLSYTGTGQANLAGGADDDTLTGGSAGDTMTGEDGNDQLYGNDANDTIDGGNGNDSASGGNGNDSITGGTGGDTLGGDGGNDTVAGNDGDDLLEGGTDADTITGGLDEDTLLGGGGDDSIQGNEGDDRFQGNDGNDRIAGGAGADGGLGDAGNDTITGDDGNDLLAGNGGDDSIEGNGGDDKISGGDDNDRLIGGSSSGCAVDGSDSVLGDDGNDVILGDDGIIGSVTLSGGNGNDTLGGGNGDDALYGQGGNDTITGDAGNDYAEGNAGDDDIAGGADNDRLIGGSSTVVATDGNDTIQGGAGADFILGDDGAISSTYVNTLLGGSGNDTARGGDTDDSIYGQAGNDSLFGDAGIDYVEGNEGGDAISGDTGDDDLIGGSSAAGTPDGGDTINGDDGHDVIAGDNAAIARVSDGAGGYDTYGPGEGLANGAVVRTVVLLDLDTIGDADLIAGGNQDDTIFAGLGDDTVYGNDGDDDLIGHLGADLINGGAGDDGILGDKGTIADALLAGPSRMLSVLNGKIIALVDAAGTKKRTATLDNTGGGGGDDVLIGGLGSDSVHGGLGADTIAGDDTAVSTTLGGNDALFGDDGNDSITGNAGGDHLYGGGGTTTSTATRAPTRSMAATAMTTSGPTSRTTASWTGRATTTTSSCPRPATAPRRSRGPATLRCSSSFATSRWPTGLSIPTASCTSSTPPPHRTAAREVESSDTMILRARPALPGGQEAPGFDRLEGIWTSIPFRMRAAVGLAHGATEETVPRRGPFHTTFTLD